jgi:glycosyltransferase involved in cell wall biosynthesis
MARFVYETAADTGYDPCLVFNVLDRDVDVRLTDLLQFDWRRRIEHTTVNGIEVKGIPRYLPEVEFLQYVLNASLWCEATADGDRYFSVGGSNHCGFPFARQGVEFGSWTATLFWEDRVDRLTSASLLRRVRDRLSKPVMEAIEGRIFDRTDPLLALSDYTADGVADRYGINRSQIDVLPYPIDTELFRPLGPETPNDDRPTVLFVGRFNDPRKDTETLLNAVASVRESIPDVRLLLVGDEPNNRIERHITELGLEATVECIDYIDNESLPDYYRAADVFAIPSRQEGLAIVGLEAMACGTPVVSTRCGGPEQYVVDGETGYLVPRGDSTAFATRLREILQDVETRGRYGNSARSCIESEYAREQIQGELRNRL